jgi:hypothetical protein
MGGMTPAVDIGDNPAEVHSARDHDLFSFYGCFPAESAALFCGEKSGACFRLACFGADFWE